MQGRGAAVPWSEEETQAYRDMTGPGPQHQGSYRFQFAIQQLLDQSRTRHQVTEKAPEEGDNKEKKRFKPSSFDVRVGRIL